MEKTLGIRTEEGEKFLKFWTLVQKEAAERGCVFFLDAGNGHSEECEDMEAEDLSGWLIPAEKVSAFQPLYEKNACGANFSEEWDDYYDLAVWKREKGSIVIRFLY